MLYVKRPDLEANGRETLIDCFVKQWLWRERCCFCVRLAGVEVRLHSLLTSSRGWIELPLYVRFPLSMMLCGLHRQSGYFEGGGGDGSLLALPVTQPQFHGRPVRRLDIIPTELSWSSLWKNSVFVGYCLGYDWCVCVRVWMYVVCVLIDGCSGCSCAGFNNCLISSISGTKILASTRPLRTHDILIVFLVNLLPASRLSNASASC